METLNINFDNFRHLSPIEQSLLIHIACVGDLEPDGQIAFDKNYACEYIGKANFYNAKRNLVELGVIEYHCEGNAIAPMRVKINPAYLTIASLVHT